MLTITTKALPVVKVLLLWIGNVTAIDKDIPISHDNNRVADVGNFVGWGTNRKAVSASMLEYCKHLFHTLGHTLLGASPYHVEPTCEGDVLTTDALHGI